MQEELKVERKEHDDIYGRASKKDPLTWDKYRQNRCIPPHEGGPIYGMDNKIFLNKVENRLLKNIEKNNVKVLDYGCGLGDMAILAAKKGFYAKGFDISKEGIKEAKKWAAKSGVKNNTEFKIANAQNLPYDEEEFDIVLGKAVLHHIIKYENTGDELKRVMKDGAKAIFSEGAASNPLIRFARRFTIKDELGDVPLTKKSIRRWAKGFSNVNIEGRFLLYMLKRLGFSGISDKRHRNFIGKMGLFNKLMEFLYEVDEDYLRRLDSKWKGRFFIELTK